MMQKEIRCPQCGGNRYQQVGNGICKCSYCGSTFTCAELQTETISVKEKKETHYLRINWKGTFISNDAPIDLNVNGTRYGHAFLGSGFSIKVPLEPVMNIILSCGDMSSSIRFSLDPGTDYEMDLEYSRMKHWFSSYIVYRQGSDEKCIEKSGDIENENLKGKFTIGCMGPILIALLIALIQFIIEAV